jgi:hypothetical protein
MINIFIFTFAFTKSVKQFHYEIYTYTECKSQLIYMHNIDSNPPNQAPAQHQWRPLRIMLFFSQGWS